MPGDAAESVLDMAERHVAEGIRHVASQREVLLRLTRVGHDTRLAESLLTAFETTLEDHIAHRDRILAERAATATDHS
jgi:hypothetical protein